ncbi:MAG: hypothetical protein ACOX2J_05925 [Bacillota bacterium]
MSTLFFVYQQRGRGFYYERYWGGSCGDEPETTFFQCKRCPHRFGFRSP